MAILPGTTLGQYTIQALVGRGGMGEVHRAVDRDGHPVAVKVLARDVVDLPGARERFEREAKLAARLRHPHICALHEIGRDHDLEFIVMEFLDGETLDARLTRGPLPVREAVARGAEIADALTCAHGCGVVHRDLKPSNVMIAATGAKLLDFGLAKAWLPALMPIGHGDTWTSGESLTTTGTVLGTVAYMSPEQLEGQDATASADIFALGAVLFEMMCGRRAFPGAAPEQIIANVLSPEPPSMAKVWRSVPSDVDAIVSKCLARRADDRWANAVELRDALRACTSRRSQ